MCFGGGKFGGEYYCTLSTLWAYVYHLNLGLQIALGADLRFSTPDCRLSIMESRWGLIPDMGAAITLREILRIDIAKELTMTGRIVSGTEAERVGLVTRCVEDPMKEAIKVALEIIERWVDNCHSFIHD